MIIMKDTSYETVRALAQILPSREYLELEDQPATMILYTPALMAQITKRNDSVNGEILKLENDICNEFQNYFSNIGPNLAMSIVHDIGDPKNKALLKNPIDASLHLRLVTVDEIKRIIYGLRSNSSGSDQITLKTVKFIFHTISQTKGDMLEDTIQANSECDGSSDAPATSIAAANQPQSQRTSRGVAKRDAIAIAL
ncbi:hypothetical protein QYM36_011822 [Artemia franciscana]|uniref:Uncharacterized protein n=1 Tax=Artemia franciscana TaxID=6661 RepID=A0AA88HE84_ARTSF|nr:hypothetical protein QYM36_011822 [Artemia franciscana]